MTDGYLLQWDVDLYQKHRFVFEYGSSLVDLLDPQPGEVILDVGCGSGQLTQEIANLGATAVGFDADASMVARATNEHPGLIFFQADATTLKISHQMDAVFSNAALHWIKDAEAAVASMVSVLKPRGRFVVEFGGKGNVQRIVQATNKVLGRPVDNDPWYFPSIVEYASLLEAHGMEVESAALFDRPTALEEGAHGMANWLRMFGGMLLQEVPETSREQVIENIVSLLREEEESMFDGQVWTADYRRLRIVARKKDTQSSTAT